MTNGADAPIRDFMNFKLNWGWLFVLGIFLVILGLIGLGMSIGLTIVSMMFFGVLLIISGISHAVYVFRYNDWQRITWEALSAIFYILAGCMILSDPILGSMVVTAFLAGVFIVIGVIRIISAIVHRHAPGWGWLLLAGIAALLVGFIIYSQWPVSGLWFIGMFVAIELLMTGWSYIFIALSRRNTP